MARPTNSNKITILQATGAGVAPDFVLEAGELAINRTDNYLFYENAAGSGNTTAYLPTADPHNATNLTSGRIDLTKDIASNPLIELTTDSSVTTGAAILELKNLNHAVGSDTVVRMLNEDDSGNVTNWVFGIEGDDDHFYYKYGTSASGVFGMSTAPLVIKKGGDVKVLGNLILDDGGSLTEAGGTTAFTFDGSGHVTKIGQDSPSSGEQLTWDGSKAVWSSAGTGEANVDTDLSKTVSGTGYSINSSTGDNIDLSIADTDNWGLMSDEMFDTLAAATTNTGTVTSVGTGTGLSGTVTVSGDLSLALDDLADMTQSWVTGVDEFIVLDDGTQKKKLSSEIFGSNAFNSTTIPTNNNELTNGAGYITSSDLSKTVSGTGYSINSSTGDNIALSIADTDNWGLMSDEMFDTLAAATTNTGTVTSVAVTTAAGLDGATTITSSGTVALSLDLDELADMTQSWTNGTDEFIVLDDGVQKKKLSSEIFGSNAFNSTTIPTNNNELTNGAGFTTNTGTTTASNAQTFTSKGGAISQWTNDSGYTTAAGTVTVSGTVNANEFARFSSGTNLTALTYAEVRSALNVEDGATADQSDAEIVAAVEAGTDSNTFTDADHSKLNAIEASATADQSDAEIKTAVEAASSIALGGSPTTTTQSASDASTKIATTAYTDTQVTTGITNLIDSSPAALNTLNELAAALGDDASFSTTVTNSIATKATTAEAHAYVEANALALTAALTTNSTIDGRDVGTDGTKLDTIASSANNYSLPSTVIHESELSSSTTSTSTSTAANSAAAKAAYDRGSTGVTNAATAQSTANAAIPKAGGTFTGDITMAEDEDILCASSGDTNIGSSAKPFGTLFAGTLTVSDVMSHGGDVDTNIAFGTNTMTFDTGGSDRFNISDSGAQFGGTGARITDIQTTISDSDTKLPTSGAVVDYVAANAASPTINSNTNNFILTGTGTSNTIQGESTLTHDGTDLTLAAAGKMYFGPNSKSYIQSTTQSWLVIKAEDTDGGTSGDIFLVSDGISLTSNNINIGGGTAYTGADPTITFNTDSNDGVMLWDESADSFQFNDDVLINSTERLNFGDTGTYIYQSADSYLSLVSDGDISLTADGDQIRFDDGTTNRFVFSLDASPEIDITGDFKIDCSGDITLDCASGSDILLSENSGTYTPSQDNHAATKKYVDDSVGSAGGGDVTGVTLASDSGSASDTTGNVDLTITGGTNVTTSATGTTLTINSTDTNTTYSVGAGGLTQQNFTTTLKNKLDGIAASANNYSHSTNANLTGDVTSSGNATTIATDAVDIAMLSASGTASSSTFLRGDNSWVTPTDTNTTYSVTDGQLSEYNFTAAFRTKVNAIEASATADQTAGEILTLLEDGIDSVHYKNGSIDNEHIADNAINSEHYADGSIDNAHIADNAINSEHYADGSIDNAHIADDAIDSEHYAAGSIDTAHIADNQITLAKMASGTDGNIISYDASGNPVAIATGTDGQVLTSTGAGSPPAFEDAAGGGGSVRTVTAGGQTLGSGETLAFTAGTNITITESGGAVTINNSAAAFSAGTDDDFEIPNQFSGVQNPMTGAIVIQIDGTSTVSVTDGIIQSYS